jgi:hypothetical protein
LPANRGYETRSAPDVGAFQLVPDRRPTPDDPGDAALGSDDGVVADGPGTGPGSLPELTVVDVDGIDEVVPASATVVDVVTGPANVVDVVPT